MGLQRVRHYWATELNWNLSSMCGMCLCSLKNFSNSTTIIWWVSTSLIYSRCWYHLSKFCRNLLIDLYESTLSLFKSILYFAIRSCASFILKLLQFLSFAYKAQVKYLPQYVLCYFYNLILQHSQTAPVDSSHITTPEHLSPFFHGRILFVLHRTLFFFLLTSLTPENSSQSDFLY